VVFSAAAPVLLVAGWTVAAALQPRSFNPVAGTVSALAAVGAADRWVMTLALAAAGACEVVTGLALRPAAMPGRLNPEHADGALTHAFWAGAGFAALVTWPGGAWRRGSSVPWGLRPAVSAVSAVAAGILLGLLAWFLAELIAAGGQAGLAERVMGAAQAGWPLAVVLSCRWPGAQTPTAGQPAPPASAEQAGACNATQPPARSPDPRGRHPGAREMPGPPGRSDTDLRLQRSGPVRMAARL